MTDISASRPADLNAQQMWVVESVREAAARHLGVQLRDVQQRAGGLLLDRCIVEMETGEGKTLSTVIPASILSRSDRARRKVLVATANDYLASRDAEWMRPIYEAMDLDVGFVTSISSADQRREAYASDVVYGTMREFAFDHLRLALSRREGSSEPSSSGPAPPIRCDVLIVDEADSLLIDEARTPLIINAPGREISSSAEACYRWSATIASDFRSGEDYVRIPDGGAVALTDHGRQRAIRTSMPDAMGPLTTTDILHALERALWVNESIHRDQHYVVGDDRIHLVDEYTGRKASERNFGGGIHQAVEAREGLPLTPESEPIARISVQDFVTQFSHLCGLTGTAWEDRHELRSVYGLKVTRVATHQPSRRQILPPIICRGREEKWQRILEETRGTIAAGRSVLIGTRTVADSEELSERFRHADLEHVVLNARNPRLEADIIANAGHAGRVTIATNMAGRGTDIRLQPQVAAAGGLHVIVSEPHAASRIDRQLIGRCGRQGDPGTARIYASPDDHILVQAFGREQADRIARSAHEGAGDRWLLAKVLQSQKRVAKEHRKERARLTAHDSSLADSMRTIGLDPHLDPLPEVR